MKAILSTLVLVGTSSAALARPSYETHRQAPVTREHRIEARRYERPVSDHRWERPRYERYRYNHNYNYYRPIVVRPWGTQTVVFNNSTTFVDQVVVTFNDGRVQTLPVGRYLYSGNIVDELGIDRACAVNVTVYGRDTSGRAFSFAAL